MRGLYGFIEGGLGGGFVFVCNDYIMLFKAWVAAISEMFTLIFYLPAASATIMLYQV